MQQLAPGDRVAARDLKSVSDQALRLPHAELWTHVQFRRFAGCPICNLHLASFSERQAEIRAHQVQELIIFHSPAAALRNHADACPFPLIADPHKQLYRAFGVEASLWALLHPSAMGAALKGLIRHGMRLPDSNPLGLPADFLLAPDGEIIDCHYGAHAYDQWSVDELLARIPSPNTALATQPTPALTQNPTPVLTQNPTQLQGAVTHD